VGHGFQRDERILARYSPQSSSKEGIGPGGDSEWEIFKKGIPFDEERDMKAKGILVLGLGLLAIQASAQDSAAPATQKDKVSYGIGVQVAKTLKGQGIDVNPDLLVKGLRDALSGQKLLMSDEDLNTTMAALQQEMTQKQMQAKAKEADDNKKAGDAFLTDNGKKDGVVTLPSGLQYKIVKPTEGKKPSDADTVSCNYRGTLIDGTEFDKSEAGQPATFQVGAVIPGFKEALKLMQVGSTWQFFIPPNLAYGERGAGNVIGPNTTLIFEVELLSIKDKTANP
jgi:UDP-GlcNAc:undecaprenyl-phosphate/decaprenyl-phosphate GlcNAc-1-phosphate transferase